MSHLLVLMRYLLVLMFTGSVFANSSPVVNESQQQSWRFNVYLDDTPIGHHHVNIEHSDNQKTVHTVANFDVRFLFIPVYSYVHETRETWVDDCLVNITSNTDDNGDPYFIRGTGKNNTSAFDLETQNGTSSINGCVRTFAYWDYELLRDSRLLNTQTGEYQETELTDLGTGELMIDEKAVKARHFRLVCEDLTIDLWYTNSMQWLALESRTSSGELLRYLPEQLPANTMESQT